MTDDRNSTQAKGGSESGSVTRRREILRRMGQASVVAGAASPLAAFAGSGRPWCKDFPNNKCVHASVSGMGSVVLSAQASNEVCAKKVSHYCTGSNWVTVNCNTQFKTAFGCNGSAVDSGGLGQGNGNCLLNKTLIDLCTNHPNSAEAHWACALGNSYKINGSDGKAPYPYTPAQVKGHYLTNDLVLKAAAYSFYTGYCENYP